MKEEVEEAKEVKKVKEEASPDLAVPMLHGNATRFTVSEWKGHLS